MFAQFFLAGVCFQGNKFSRIDEKSTTPRSHENFMRISSLRTMFDSPVPQSGLSESLDKLSNVLYNYFLILVPYFQVQIQRIMQTFLLEDLKQKA